MIDWFEKALEHADKSQADIARYLSHHYPVEWSHNHRSAEMKLSRMKKSGAPEKKERVLSALEMVQISHATGYPLPTSPSGEVEWTALVQSALSSAKMMGASDSELLGIAFDVVPVSVVPLSERQQFESFSAKLSQVGNPGGADQSVDEVLDDILAQLRTA